MAPTTHAAVGAAIAHMNPNLRFALPAAFASHFVCDAIFHFEAFYPLSRLLGTTYKEAFWVSAVVLSAFLLPAMGWIVRKDRDLGVFVAYALATSLALVVDGYWNRLFALVAITAAAWPWIRRPDSTLWLGGAFCAIAPDCIKKLIEPFDDFHFWMHYEGRADLGYWITWLTGQPDPPWIGGRITQWTYLTGYALELAIEGFVLLAALWLMSRPRKAAP